MPTRISPEKESNIIKLFLTGMTQTEIANQANVSQSTISEVISRYKEDASKTSLDGASASRGVHNEVDTLRSLSIDMRSAGITVNDVKKACQLVEKLSKIGADLTMLDKADSDLDSCRRLETSHTHKNPQ
jgi:orotate phosphoribosyltransferase-like protein